MADINFEPALKKIAKVVLTESKMTKDCKELLQFLCRNLNSELIRETKVAYENTRKKVEVISSKHAQSAVKKFLTRIKLKDFAVLQRQKEVYNIRRNNRSNRAPELPADIDIDIQDVEYGGSSQTIDSIADDDNPSNDTSTYVNDMAVDSMDAFSSSNSNDSSISTISDECSMISNDHGSDKMLHESEGSDSSIPTLEEEMTNNKNTEVIESSLLGVNGTTVSTIAKDQEIIIDTQEFLKNESNSNESMELQQSRCDDRSSLTEQQMLDEGCIPKDYKEGLVKLAACLTGNCTLEDRAYRSMNYFLTLLSQNISKCSSNLARMKNHTVLTQEDVEEGVLQILPTKMAEIGLCEGRMAAVLQSCGQLSLHSCPDESVRSINEMSGQVHASMFTLLNPEDDMMETEHFPGVHEADEKEIPCSAKYGEDGSETGDHFTTNENVNDTTCLSLEPRNIQGCFSLNFFPGILKMICDIPALLPLEQSAGVFLTETLEYVCKKIANDSLNYCQTTLLTDLEVMSSVRSTFVGKLSKIALTEGHKAVERLHVSDQVEHDSLQTSCCQQHQQNMDGAESTSNQKLMKRSWDDSAETLSDTSPYTSDESSGSHSIKRVRFTGNPAYYLAGNSMRAPHFPDIQSASSINDEILEKLELERKRKLEAPSTSRKGILGRPRKLKMGQVLQVIKFEESVDRKVKTFYLRVIDKNVQNIARE